jgi:hypothetical protein
MTQDTDQPDVPVQFQEYSALLATRDGFLKDNRDFSQFQGKISEYQALMHQDADQRNIDAPRSIVMTENDGYEIFI